jgi:glycosyltransferase involved in cell wall biosynthesis
MHKPIPQAAAFYQQGVSFLRRGECQGAGRLLKKTIAIDRKHPFARKMLLRLSLGLRDFPLSPKISVIMPTYNRSHLISRAIKSVLGQTFRNFELIVINDGSTDETEKAVRRFKDKRIIYIKRKHAGVSAARNVGLAHALGEYIAYLDDDDCYYSCHLKALSRFLDRHKEMGLVYSKSHVIFDDMSKKPRGEPEYEKKKLEYRCLWGVNSVMHRRDCIEKSGNFDERLQRGEDWDLWLRVGDAYQIKRIPRFTTSRSYHGGNTTVQQDSGGSFGIIVEKRFRQAKKNGLISWYVRNCAIPVVRELISRKDVARAVRLADRIYRIDKSYRALGCRGACAMAKGDFDKAVQYLFQANGRLLQDRHIAHRSFRDERNWIKINLALAYYKSGKINDARILCARLLKASPKYPNARITLAKCLIQQRKYDRALRMLSRASSDSDSHHLRGACYCRQGKYRWAEQAFQKAISMDKGNSYYRHNLAVLKKYA